MADEGTYEYWFERKGRRLRVETRYARHSETRVFEGTSGFRGQGGGPLVKVTDFRYEAMLYQYKHIDLMFGLIRGDYQVEEKGEASTPSGRRARAFGLSDEEGPAMFIYLDPSSGILMAVTGGFDIEGRATQLSTEYYDYREVEGLMMPHRMLNYAGGTMIAETVIESYGIDSP